MSKETETIQDDIDFVRSILPDHYEVKESKKAGSIHCKSEKGIRKSPFLNESTGRMINDAEDEEHWSYIFRAVKQHFGERFQEVYHNTCFCHVDFTIYLKTQQP
jgi:hypothetical protein